MYHFAAALFAGIIATGLISGTAFVPTPAEAAKMSKADTVALKEATVACKAEAKDKKVKWLARRKYVYQCVAEALKGRPSIDVNEVRRGVNMKGLQGQRPGEWGLAPPY